MHGDFSRWTFEPAAGYRSVLLQQGRVLLDADWNEQGAITARHDEVRTRDIIGRAGGPVGGAAFGITDAAGAVPSATPATTPWADLRLSAGRFYVGGVLAEVAATAGGAAGLGPALGDQPFLRKVGALPGLAEETTNGRYAVVLDIWTRHVTADEAPRLLESALGGPDTTTRAQTVWQVRLRAVGATDTCSSLTGASWLTRTPPTMTASLSESPPGSDPCQISTSAGYRRLENQLYRVQVHSVNTATGAAQYVWSRENGSVVAKLLQSTAPAGVGADRDLHLDREGRDEELSFRAGDLVEVTSRDRELHGMPGLLATAGSPDALVLPVTWIGGAGADPAANDPSLLGGTPIVRRWEGGPTPANASPDDLEGGIRVAFDAGDFRVGDHWLIPARTVRLVYGVTALAGTIEWPTAPPAAPGGTPTPLPQPPVGPERQRTVVAVLERAGTPAAGTWRLVSDCRRLTPPMTELVTLDLLGGDGQESLPGAPLPEPVRVVVRNGGLAVAGAPVRFITAGDHLAENRGSPPAVPTSADPTARTVTTDAAGHAEVRWLLGAGAGGSVPDTHVLTAVRLDDAGNPIGAQVRVTGRRSVASQVAWNPVCGGFSASTTVQAALAQLATTRDLRLLGGDGQQVRKPGSTVPHEVRVVLDSPCGPVKGEMVRAEATQGGLVVAAAPGSTDPGGLAGSGATSSAETTTDENGVAAFWWQPDVVQQLSDVLNVVAKGAEAAPIRVNAHLAQRGGGGRRPGGVHITELHFSNGEPFRNDDDVKVETLASGIMVDLDGPVLPETLKAKPVVRVVLDVPWPVRSDGEFWNREQPIGFTPVEIEAEIGSDGPLIVWRPSNRAAEWLVGRFPQVLRELAQAEFVVGRFIVDGWAIISEADESQHLNGHARTVVERSTGRTRFELPTDDEVTGGQFVQWFRTGMG